jgi:hypothetical protein
MPKDKTQEPEDKKGQEEEKEEGKQQSPEEQEELFSEGFQDATKNKGSDSEDSDKVAEKGSKEKSGEGDKDKSAEKDESDKDGSEGKDSTKEKSEEEGEGEEEGQAKKEIEARAKRLKGIMEGEEEEKEEEEKKPKKKATKKKKAKEEEPEEEEEEEEEEKTKSLLKNIKLSEAEKDFLEDMPEVQGILDKVVKKALKGINKENVDLPEELIEVLENQNAQIAVLRTQATLNKMVPDWESIVFDGNNILETGERKPNEAFWSWLDGQPDLYRALANSDNPRDNAAVLNYYKESKAKEKLSEKDEESKNKLKKTQDIHSHSANDKKTAKKTKRSIEENDFGSHFAEAGKKAEKGQI